MEKQHALQQLEQLQKKLYAIHYACSAMNLDADTVAPKNTSEGRGVALGVLAGEEQQLMICPETRALLDELDREPVQDPKVAVSVQHARWRSCAAAVTS